MPLTLITISESLYRTGSDTFEVQSGNRFKIKSGDTDILNEKVPNEKKWKVYITLRIDEVDA